MADENHFVFSQVIIMSATIDPDDFERFWGQKQTRIVYLEGRQHPLECRSVTVPLKDHVEACITAAQNVHYSDEPGDILCFLAGEFFSDKWRSF